MISGSRVALSVCLVALCHAAWADEPLLGRVLADLSAVTASTAHFSENKYTAALTEPLHSEGTLVWTAPDHVQKDTTAPEPETLSVTGAQLTITRDGDTHTLDLGDYPEIAGLIESTRAVLAGNPAAIEPYFLRIEGDEAHWTLFLQPPSSDARNLLASIRIVGSKGVLREIDTTSASGDRSEMTITPIVP